MGAAVALVTEEINDTGFEYEASDDALIDEAVVRVAAWLADARRPYGARIVQTTLPGEASRGTGSHNTEVSYSATYLAGVDALRLSGARDLLINRRVRRVGFA